MLLIYNASVRQSCHCLLLYVVNVCCVPHLSATILSVSSICCAHAVLLLFSKHFVVIAYPFVWAGC